MTQEDLKYEDCKTDLSPFYRTPVFFALIPQPNLCVASPRTIHRSFIVARAIACTLAFIK